MGDEYLEQIDTATLPYRILVALHREPDVGGIEKPRSATALANLLDVSRSSIHNYLNPMQNIGVLRKTRDGKSASYEVDTGRLAEIMDYYLEPQSDGLSTDSIIQGMREDVWRDSVVQEVEDNLPMFLQHYLDAHLNRVEHSSIEKMFTDNFEAFCVRLDQIDESNVGDGPVLKPWTSAFIHRFVMHQSLVTTWERHRAYDISHDVLNYLVRTGKTGTFGKQEDVFERLRSMEPRGERDG